LCGPVASSPVEVRHSPWGRLSRLCYERCRRATVTRVRVHLNTSNRRRRAHLGRPARRLRWHQSLLPPSTRSQSWSSAETRTGGRRSHRWRRRQSGDAGVQRRPVLRNGSGVVTVEDLALHPLGATVTGGAIRREDHSAGRHIDGLGLIQRTHSSKDPQISRRSME